MHKPLVEHAPFTEKEAVIGAMHDRCVVENVLLLEIVKDTSDILIHSHQPGVVVLHHSFERSASRMRRCCADLVFGIHKTFRLAWISLQIVIESFWLRSRDSAIQTLRAPRGKNGLVRSENPAQRAEGFIPPHEPF